MENVITLAEFNNSIEFEFVLLKNMLDQAGIKYFVINENARTVEPLLITPSNMSIEIKIFETDFDEAQQLLKSIS